MSTLKYLLISPGKPKTIVQSSNPTTEILAMFPVGLAYISASMKKAGFEIFTVNSNFSESDVESTLTDIITKNDIGAVCTGGKSIDVHNIIDIIGIVRRIDSKIKIIVGGAIISSDPETAMNVLGADIGVIGEGEETMCDLALALNNNTFIGDVPGIIFRQNGELLRSRNRSEIKNIDLLPFMDFDGFAYSEWLEINGNTGIIYSARSCPFQCTFCFQTTGGVYRRRSLDSVFDEIDYQVEKYHIRSIAVSDELFSAEKNRIFDFCNRIQQYKINWICSLRVSEIETDLLRLMKNSGCTMIATGLESGSPEILKSMRKGITVQQLENALEVFANSEVIMLGNLIFGDVNETKETAKTSIDFWNKYNQKIYINLGTVCTFPGSQIYKLACQKGLISNKEQYLKDGSFFINTTKMDDADYFDMLSQITELSYLPQIPAKSSTIQNVKGNGFCEAKWQCRRCNAVHLLPNVHFLQAPICTCSCGVQNTVELCGNVTVNSIELMAALPDDEVIAFWGVGSQYCRLARFYACFNSNRFVQVDSNKHQQKMTRLGRKIYAPDIIAQKEIKSVIITSPTAKDAILKTIEHEYPSVSNVFFPNLLRRGEKFIPVFQRIPFRTESAENLLNPTYSLVCAQS